VNMQSSHSGHKTRGAALIVAIGILAVLLVISVTFFRMSLQEMDTATNNATGIQADLLADGAIAMAMDTLQQDQAMNPGVTHSDQAWRSKYNGTAYIGKQWWEASGTTYTLMWTESIPV
jgi:type II secretory pathway component PulK